MKNILTFLVFIVFISCNNNDENKRSYFEEPIRKIVFVIDKSSDSYKNFLDEKGKVKKNIGIIVGKYKFILDEIIENMTLPKVEENVSFLGLTTKGSSTGGAPGFKILKYVCDEIGKPFYITIDNEKKFEIIVAKTPKSAGYGEMRVNTDITVNGKETKFIFNSFQPYIILK